MSERRLSYPVRRLNIRIYAYCAAIPASASRPRMSSAARATGQLASNSARVVSSWLAHRAGCRPVQRLPLCLCALATGQRGVAALGRADDQDCRRASPSWCGSPRKPRTTCDGLAPSPAYRRTRVTAKRHDPAASTEQVRWVAEVKRRPRRAAIVLLQGARTTQFDQSEVIMDTCFFLPSSNRERENLDRIGPG